MDSLDVAHLLHEEIPMGEGRASRKKLYVILIAILAAIWLIFLK